MTSNVPYLYPFDTFEQRNDFIVWLSCDYLCKKFIHDNLNFPLLLKIILKQSISLTLNSFENVKPKETKIQWKGF